MAVQNWSSVREVFIHWPGEGVHSYSHIDTRSEAAAQIRAWQAFHMDVRDWSDIGYSFVCFQPRGGLSMGDSLWRARGGPGGSRLYVPASQLAHNTGTVSVCVALGDREDLLSDTKSRLRSFHRWAEGRAGHGLQVRGHGEVFGTECPGPKLRALVKELNG